MCTSAHCIISSIDIKAIFNQVYLKKPKSIEFFCYFKLFKFIKYENLLKTEIFPFFRDLFRKRSCRKSKRRSCSPLGTACLSGNGATNPSTPISMGPNDINDCPTPPSSAQNRYRT